MPSAIPTSWKLYFNEPATGATYLNDSPIIETFVFALLEAFANTSARVPASPALLPNAVNASVTISDVVAKSKPSAAARFIIPSIPSIIDLVSQPAIAMYVNASAASVAENFVLAPISIAFAFKSTISFPVAPDIAFTFERLDSNEAEVLTAAAPKPTIGVVTLRVISLPVDAKPLLTPLSIPLTPPVPFLNFSTELNAFLNPIVNLEVSKSKYPTAVPKLTPIKTSPHLLFILLINLTWQHSCSFLFYFFTFFFLLFFIELWLFIIINF